MKSVFAKYVMMNGEVAALFSRSLTMKEELNQIIETQRMSAIPTTRRQVIPAQSHEKEQNL